MQPLVRPAVRIAAGYSSRLGLQIALTTATATRSSQSTIPPLLSRLRYRAEPYRLYSQGSKKDSSDDSASTSKPSVAENATPSSSQSIPELPSTKDNNRSPLNQKFSHVMDNLQARVLTASQTLNDITGYSAIDTIKAENEAMEISLAAAQERVRTARQAYKTSNAKRAATQREVTTLLARKDTWSPTDLERFTELYRTDHVLEGEVSSAQESLTESEAEEQSLSQRLNAGILKRYHEEQIWSDRIRRASTWGTWGLMGMNFLLFVVLQFFAEPWRRRRLVRGVVEQEKEVLEGVRSEMATLKAHLEEKIDKAVADNGRAGRSTEPLPVKAAPPPLSDCQVPVYKFSTWQEFLLDPAQWKEKAIDLYSERRLDMTMRDVSVVALEGALAGAAVAGGLALLLVRQS